MNKFLLSTLSIAVIFSSTVAHASDLPNRRYLYLPVTQTYVEPKFNVDVGYMRAVRSQSNFVYTRLSYVYNGFVPMIEYGYAERTNQYVAGGLGYNIRYHGLTIRPNVKAGYNWNQGRFIAPSIELSYSVNQNFSLTGRYDYVIRGRNKFDHYVGGALTFKF